MRAKQLGLVLVSYTLLAGCAPEQVPPTPDKVQPAFMAKDALPIVLTYPDGPALEAIQAGTLRRSGPCLFLDSGGGNTLILWGDDIRASRHVNAK
ncbi:hypothetical protein OAS19_06475 [Altererythrobacter sp.]|nr:hypothetical protein [Altererythrobacter sp.]